LVGWLGQAIGLQWTFAALIPLVVAVALGARVLGTPAGSGRRGGSETVTTG
jgi:hypothetical protein